MIKTAFIKIFSQMDKVFFLVLLFLSTLATAQSDDFLKSGPTSNNSKEEFDAEYKKNIRKSKINGLIH